MSGYNENSDNQSDSDQTATGWIEKNPTLSALGGLYGVRAGSALAKYLYAAAKAGVGGLGRLTGSPYGLAAMAAPAVIASGNATRARDMAAGQPYPGDSWAQAYGLNPTVPPSIPDRVAPGPAPAPALRNTAVPDILAPTTSGALSGVNLQMPQPNLPMPQATVPLPQPRPAAANYSNGVPLAGLTPPGVNFGAPQAQSSQNLLQQFAKLLSDNAAAYSGPGSQNFTGMY